MDSISTIFPVIWGIIVVGMVLYRLIAPKAKAQDPNMPVGEEELEVGESTIPMQQTDDPYRPRTVEEILEQLFEKEQQMKKRVEKPQRSVVAQPTQETRKVTTTPVVNRTEKKAKKQVPATALVREEIGDKISMSEGQSHTDETVDFDLRQAVIMSEILTRKYDE